MVKFGPSVITLAEWCRIHEQDGGNWRRRVAAGKVPGAYRSGRIWLIPASTVPPAKRGRGRPQAEQTGAAIV